MSDKLKITVISDKDRDWVSQAAQFVFSRYTGGLHKWDFSDTEEIWKISFGGRAGVLGVNVLGRCCCVKLYYDNRVHIKMRNRLGFSKARRAFRKGLELKRRGVLCPEMLGWAVDGKTGLALLVTELIYDADRVDKCIEKWQFAKGQIKILAEYIRNMHDSGVAHKDLSLRNIMAGQRNGRVNFWLLDYEDAEFSLETSQRQRVKNLHHLNERALSIMELKDRLYFLRYYINDVRQLRSWARDLRNYMQQHPSKYTESYLKKGSIE